MSEFLAEARVLIRPDTTKFRAELQREINAAVKGVTASVPITATAATNQASKNFLATTNATTVALREQADTQRRGAEETRKAAAEDRHRAQTLGQVQKASFAAGASLAGLRGAVLTAGTAFLGVTVAIQAFLQTLQDFSEFQRNLNVLRVTSRASAEDIERVSDAAKELGADLTLPGASAADAARSMLELSKAGLSIEDSLAGARGVLELSTAAMIDQAAAAELTANALNAFGLAGDQAVRVADVLANAANASQGSITDFGIAMRQAAAVSQLVGFSFEEMAAQLTILARAGLTGSDAGTSLRVALLRLINPTKEAAAIIKQLGIDVRDAQGNIRPDVFVQFGEATQNFSKSLRDAQFAAVFGADALRTVSIAAQAGRDDLIRATGEISRQGTAAELAAAQTEGFGGQVEAFKNQMATASVETGKLAAILAGPLVVGLSQAASGFVTLITPINDLIDRTIELGKRLSGGIDFDASTASTAEFLAELRRLREEQAQISGAQADELKEAFGPALDTAIRNTIKSLKAERSELRALGQDTTEIDALIKAFRGQLSGLAADAGKPILSPLQKQIEDLVAVRKELDLQGIDTSGIDKLIARLEEEARAAAETARENDRLTRATFTLGNASSTAAGGVQTLAQALRDLKRESSAAQAEILRLQTEGGSSGQIIGALQADIQTQRDIIAEAKARGGKGSATAIENARRQILSDQAQIDSLIAEQESAARKAKDDAQKVRDDQDEALLTLLGQRREDQNRRVERASETSGLQDDIRAQNNLQALIQQQIQKIRDRIQDEQKRAAAIRELRIALIKSRAEEERLREEQKRQAQEQAAEILDIRIQIAETKGQVALEKRLLQEKIRRLKAQIKAAKGNKLLVAQLRLELAQTQKELEDLNKQQEETNKAGKTLAQSQFEFLQSLQGFSTNLLGNLIPGFATGGLVGPGSGQTTRPLDVGGAPQERVAQADAVRSAQDRGVRPIQVDTTNQLLRQILRTLQGHHAGTGHPEIVHNRRVGAALMDTLGTVHGA